MTGVQTCALPISTGLFFSSGTIRARRRDDAEREDRKEQRGETKENMSVNMCAETQGLCACVWSVCVGSTHVAAMTTSSVVTGWVRERSWPLLRRLSTAAFRDRSFGGPPSMLFSNSCMMGGEGEKQQTTNLNAIKIGRAHV